MHIFIVYSHPSEQSFTAKVKDSFIKGLTEAGHTYEISDLYKMKFDAIFTEDEYDREAYYDNIKPVHKTILAEQEKISHADKIVFIYPDFWTEAPAMLVGWFQKVWTYGFAYGPDRTMKQLEEAIFLVTMGGSLDDPIRKQQVEAMKTVMIGDRIHDRAKRSRMILFDQMTRGYGNDNNREERIRNFTNEAYLLGKNI